MIFMMSVISTEVIRVLFEFARFVNTSLIPLKPCTSGSGPEATPPKPLIGSP